MCDPRATLGEEDDVTLTEAKAARNGGKVCIMRGYAIQRHTYGRDVHRNNENDEKGKVPRHKYGYSDDWMLRSPVAILMKKSESQNKHQDEL